MAGCFVLGAPTSPTRSEHISYVLCRRKQDAPHVEEIVHINPGKYSSPPSKASSEKRFMTDLFAEATAVDLDEELDDFMHSRGRATKKVSAGVCALMPAKLHCLSHVSSNHFEEPEQVLISPNNTGRKICQIMPQQGTTLHADTRRSAQVGCRHQCCARSRGGQHLHRQDRFGHSTGADGIHSAMPEVCLEIPV
jgi:hypothetical protein